MASSNLSSTNWHTKPTSLQLNIMDQNWLDRCSEDNMPLPAFDRFIHVLPDHVVKRRRRPGETGYKGYEPRLPTLEMRDENEILAMELVREHTTIPVPKLIHRGDGFNVFERFQGVTVRHRAAWEKVAPRQREAIRLQVRGYIEQLAKIPSPSPGAVRTLVASGETFHPELPHPGPFDSTKRLLEAYANVDVPLIHQIPVESVPLFSHMDWDLSNVVIAPNLDSVVGIIDWEYACFFPEGGRSIHRMCYHLPGWDTLFDDVVFPAGTLPKE